MSTELPADLTRRGRDSEVKRHRTELARAVEAATRQLDTLRQDLAAGEELHTHAARQLVVDLSEVAQRMSALATLEQVTFALPDQPD